MKRYPLIASGLIVALICLAAPAMARKNKDKEEPKNVVVQHVLISFKGSNSHKKDLTRSKKQAERLAYEILERAKKGEDFDALVKEYTDDQYPGIYAMSNSGLGSPPGGVNRDGMVPEFGDIAFGLEVGEVGIARYSVGGSPYGFHVIKRLE